MKFLIIFVIFMAIGCGAGNPVPEEAVKACLEKGGIPRYNSGGCTTNFTCVDLKNEQGDKNDR